MKFQSKVDARGRVIIPKAIRDHLDLDRYILLEFQLKGTTLILTPKQKVSNFDLAIKRYGGSLRKQMLADGYASTDEYINDIRGR